MIFARHRPLNIPRSWSWDDSTRQYVAMGFDPVSCLKYSTMPAPEPAEGNNIGFLLGGRVGSYRLGAVEVYTPSLRMLSSSLSTLPMSSMTSTSTHFLVLMDTTISTARYVLDGEPMVTIKAEDGIVLWGNSVEHSGVRVVTRGYREASKLPVFSAEDLARLMATVDIVGADRDGPIYEKPMVDPRWPLKLQVEFLANNMQRGDKWSAALDARIAVLEAHLAGE